MGKSLEEQRNRFRSKGLVSLKKPEKKSYEVSGKKGRVTVKFKVKNRNYYTTLKNIGLM